MDKHLTAPPLIQTIGPPARLPPNLAFSHLTNFLHSLPSSPNRTQLERLTDALGVELGLIEPSEGLRREAERAEARAKAKEEKRRLRREKKKTELEEEQEEIGNLLGREKMEGVEGLLEGDPEGQEEQGAVGFDDVQEMDERGDIEYGDVEEDDDDEPDNENIAVDHDGEEDEEDDKEENDNHARE